MTDEKKQKTGISSTLPSRKSFPPFGALRAFDAVARLGGIRKAAQGLERDHAVISRHIKSIEEWTGAILVERKLGGISLTDEGREYHAKIAEALDQISSATTDLMKRNETGSVQIWAMPAFSLHWLTERLARFEKEHPTITIEVRPTDQSPDLHSHEADVDIRFVPRYGNRFKVAQGLKSFEFARPSIIIVASPEYLKKHSKIKCPTDLLDHELLHENSTEKWSKWLTHQGVKEVGEIKGPLLWQGHLTLDSARHGRGITLTNQLIVVDDLESGKLVEVGCGNDSFNDMTLGSYLFIARADRWEHNSLRCFRMWLASEVQKTLK